MDAAQVPRRRLAHALRAPAVWVALLVLLGLALRLEPLLRDPLHQDEALYGFWGRLIGSGRDPWLATVPVDKPPLALYLIAGSQMAFGARPFSLRLPGLAASLLAVPLTYALACRLYGSVGRTRAPAIVAAAAMALTPYAVLFGAVAFTDALLVLWWLAAAYAAVRGRWGWAGLALGLAFATKQQALALAPLVIGLGLCCRPEGQRRWKGPLVRFLSACGVVVGIVFAWDFFRVANTAGGRAAVGFWRQGVASYGGLRLIWPAELTPRLRGWTELVGYLLGGPWLTLLFGLAVGVLLWRALARRRGTRPALLDVTLIAFLLFYLFLHLLVAFPVWDRYLLPLVPPVALLLGRLVTLWPRMTRQAALLLGVLWLAGGLLAAGGRIPVGGDHGAYDGLEQVVAHLRRLPVGTVLYDRWLSWHYDFYLFDAYLYRAGFPSPAWLAKDAAALYDGRPRYLVLPDWQPAARLTRTLTEAGLTMSPALTTHRRDGSVSFVVYEIGLSDTVGSEK